MGEEGKACMPLSGMVMSIVASSAVNSKSQAEPKFSVSKVYELRGVSKISTNNRVDVPIGDDLSRDVYCVLGAPIDVCDVPSVLRNIETAAAKKMRLFISAPNLNYLINMQADADFRESLLESDLCPADGMSIVLIARLFGVPIKNRVAGSDIFEALKAMHNSANPLKVFMFGGPEGVAAAACQALNTHPGGVYCVGSYYPGFASVESMSGDEIIERINLSNADFLVVALGGKKGQAWLQRNKQRLLIPVRAHLGAVINFQAGTIRRAPSVMGRLGLEWLWRIKEEPYLWRRYWNDGWLLLRMLFPRILPLIMWTQLLLKYRCHREDLVIREISSDETITMNLSGAATVQHVEKVIPIFRSAIETKKRIVINFSGTRAIDARFLGLLLMLRKSLKGNGVSPTFTGLSPQLESIFRLNGVAFLLSSDNGV
jgi:N-acetylglucosaminyldiphosphoundecaprenol N-acetyl-beta-D-mannosaminyltransferase